MTRIVIFFPLTLLVALLEVDQELCTCGTMRWQHPGNVLPKRFHDPFRSSIIAEIIRQHNKE